MESVNILNLKKFKYLYNIQQVNEGINTNQHNNDQVNKMKNKIENIVVDEVKLNFLKKIILSI